MYFLKLFLLSKIVLITLGVVLSPLYYFLNYSENKIEEKDEDVYPLH